MIIFFIGLGVFNSVTTWIEDIMRPRGFSATQAGITGGMMIVGGVIGALMNQFSKRISFRLIFTFALPLVLPSRRMLV